MLTRSAQRRRPRLLLSKPGATSSSAALFQPASAAVSAFSSAVVALLQLEVAVLPPLVPLLPLLVVALLHTAAARHEYSAQMEHWEMMLAN